MDINVTSYCDNFPLNIGNFYENFSCSEEINYPETSHCNADSDYSIKISAKYPLFSTFLLSKFSD